MRHIKYQSIRIQVAGAGTMINFSADTDKLYEKITGISLELPYEANLFGSQIGINIAGVELFPENYEAKRLCASQDVSPNERFYQGTKENPLFDDAHGNQVSGKFTDGGNAALVAFPYTAILTLRLENIDKKE